MPVLFVPYSERFWGCLTERITLLLRIRKFPRLRLWLRDRMFWLRVFVIFLQLVVPISGHCLPTYYSRYLQILFNIIIQFFPHDLPVSLVPFFLAFTICFGILSLFALLICPYHLILSDFANFTVSAPCRVSCISLRLLVLRLHSYFMWPYFLLLTAFLSNVPNGIHFSSDHCRGFCPVA